MTTTPTDAPLLLVADLSRRDEAELARRAVGWVVTVRDDEFPTAPVRVYGVFDAPTRAAWAADELRSEFAKRAEKGEAGWTVRAEPLLPYGAVVER